jgi:tyrosyl-tRNA synthetase
VLSGAEIDANARTFAEQAGKVLDMSRVEVRFNSEWLDMKMEELFKLARTTTVAQLLERDDFAKRWAARQPISVLELLYPLMQGYDSVAVRADVELGGTDQKFNLLLGRDIQREYGQPEQVVMTMPLLPGIDGVQKMAKSIGNYIGVTEPPEEIYGKTMRLPDEAMPLWYGLLLGRSVPAGLPARDAKRELARSLVARFAGGDDAARAAEEHFDRLFVAHDVPDDVPEVDFPHDGTVHLPALLRAAFGLSTSEARRLIAGGGVRVDGEPIDALDVEPDAVDGRVVQVGKRRFARVKLT